MQIQNKYLQQLRHIVLEHLQDYNVDVFLFGSRAKGIAQTTSDVDIALLPKQPINDAIINELIDKIEESTIPYTVDVIDLRKVDDKFRQKVLSEAIKWND